MMQPPIRTPEKYHADEHNPAVPFDECWDCGRARAICRSKIRFASRELASSYIQRFNEERGFTPPVVRYPCRWCVGYHMKTARRAVDRGRAEKQRRKWLRRTRSEGAV